MAHQKWNLSGKRLREAEFRLWGGIGEEAAASLVFLRVQVQNKLQEASLSDYAKGLNDPLGYVLFTARKTKTGLPEMKLGKEGLRWMVQWCLSEKANETDKQQVLETLRWWVTLGGLGGRTRRGCGVFMAEGVEPVSTDEMCELGCKILFSGSDKKVKDAWIDAITEWKETRRKHKAEFRRLLGRNDEHSRHLATIFSRPVYADKGYDSKENRQHLKEHQLLDGIMCKAHRNRPLTENQTKRNRYLSKTRYVVEQSFGTLHRKFRYARAAYFGLLKVSAQSHLKAMCLNLLKAANRLSAPVAA